MEQIKITDNLEELLDVVDDQDQVIGRATRGECNSNPDLIHRAAYVLIFNKNRHLFLHKRSKTKDKFPGWWSISAAGHVAHGETYEQTIQREMREEIGVLLPVVFLGKFLLRHVTESEYAAVFKAYSEGPFCLHQEEIEAGAFFSMEKTKNKMWEVLTPFSQMVLEILINNELIFID